MAFSRSVWPLLMLALLTGPAVAQELEFRRYLAGFEGWRIASECPERTYGLLQAENAIEFCVPFKNAKQRRCEIALHGPDVRDKNVTLSYEVLLGGNWRRQDDWVIIQQIASRTDPGENWRCPLSSLEVYDLTLRMFSRSDLSRVTDTSRSTCALGTIKTQSVFRNVPVHRQEWTKIELNLRLSLGDGHVGAKIRGQKTGEVFGATTYNDISSPYLKFGVYKPPPRSGDGTYCALYRNITLKSGAP